MGAPDSEPARSFPSPLRRLLEAADASSQEQAWAEFVAVYSRLILHVARQTPGDYDAIMDRYSFVLDRLRDQDCRRLRTYAADGRGKFTTWLTVVVRRLCLDHHRLGHGRVTGGDSRRRAAPRRLVELVFLEPERMDLLRDGALAADEELERSQSLERLEAAIATLNSNDQLLLALRYRDERTAREIASLMSFATPFHVYRRLNWVHRHLRQALNASAAGGPAAVQYQVKP